MATLRMLGHWLNGSGWIQCLIQAGIATLEFQSLLLVPPMSNGLAMFILLQLLLCLLICTECTQSTYSEYCDNNFDDSVISFGLWRADREQSSASNCDCNWNYWNCPVVEYSIGAWTAIASFCVIVANASFSLYTDCMQQLAGWFSACD